jgi:ATP-dependent DNA helicase RecQ
MTDENLEDLITATMRIEWGRIPRKLQMEGCKAILQSRGSSVCVIAKTGIGKSFIRDCVSSILGGVTISISPLVVLGSDQVRKIKMMNSSIRAIHADETFGKQLQIVEEELSKQQEFKTNCTIVISPQALASEDGCWRRILMDLAKKQVIEFVTFDEAHCVVNDDSFRPEFGGLKKNLIQVIEEHQNFCPSYLTMSATFPIAIQIRYKNLLGIEFTDVVWGQMDRRTIDIAIIPQGRTGYNLEVAGK